MKLLLSQSGVGPIVTLGFGASGEPAILADAPLVTALRTTDQVLLNRSGQLMRAPQSLIGGDGGGGAVDLLASFTGMSAQQQAAFAQAVLVTLPTVGVLGAQRTTGVPMIDGGLVVVPQES